MSELGVHDADVCGDAAAYVLGALERDEAHAFTHHLEACVVCRDEVTAFEEVLSVLPMAAPQLRAPKRLRLAIIRAVRRERKAGRRLGSHGAGRAAPDRRPRFAWVALGPAAAIAAATLVILLLSSGGPAKREIEARVLTGPGQAEVLLSGAHSELIVHGLRPPAPSHVYEVWVQRGHSSLTPADVLFNLAPSGDAHISLPGGLQGVRRLLVTVEREGGSPVPTSSPVIVAQLT